MGLHDSLPDSGRRAFLGRIVSAASWGAVFGSGVSAAEPPPDDGMSLSIGNYGLPEMSVEEAVDLVAEVGFDGIELALLPNWDSSPQFLSRQRCTALRRRIADRGLALTSLMEDLPATGDDYAEPAALERLRRAAEVGRLLSPDNPPLVQTTLGAGAWDAERTRLSNRLAAWSALADERQTTLAIKPHRSGAMSQPGEAAWLIEQLDRPQRLRMVYDYSHYAFRDLSIMETVAAALPYLGHVAVKDAARSGDAVTFALPGETGAIDHSAILTALYAGGYRGDVCCEVSSQVFRRPDYEPLAAARTCYERLSRAFEQCGIPRRRRG